MLCQSCGRTLEPTAQFCGECGAQVGAIAGTPMDAAAASGPVTTPDLPVAPPVAPPPPGTPPPPPPGVPTYAGAMPTDGPPEGGSSQRWALWLFGALAVLIVAFLASVAYYVLLRDDGGDDEAAPPATTADAPPVTSAPTTTAEPTDDTKPSDDTTPPDETDTGGSVSVESYCENAEALGALLQEAIDDPFNADAAEITERASQLSEEAAEVTAGASPEELERINECTAALNVSP